MQLSYQIKLGGGKTSHGIETGLPSPPCSSLLTAPFGTEFLSRFPVLLLLLLVVVSRLSKIECFLLSSPELLSYLSSSLFTFHWPVVWIHL